MLAIKLFVIALLVFLIGDALWLGVISKSYYIQAYKPWLRLEGDSIQPLWWAAGVVYFLLALSIVVFALPLAAGSCGLALLYGAVLGAVVYGVYDFTTLSILKDWPVGMAFIDWGWGIFLCALSAWVTCCISRVL